MGEAKGSGLGMELIGNSVLVWHETATSRSQFCGIGEARRERVCDTVVVAAKMLHCEK